jgi:peptidoglycan hydrolase-like protein with peptidoglycan-binding domain
VVFGDLTLDAALRRDTAAEYTRVGQQIRTQCGGVPANLASQGTVGHGVAEIQIVLNGHGPSVLPQLVVDGIFGPLTKRWVIEFQTQNGLAPDGIVGPKTREKLGLATT